MGAGDTVADEGWVPVSLYSPYTDRLDTRWTVITDEHSLVRTVEKQIGGSGGSLEPPGPLLDPPERLPTGLNPLAEKACFSQVRTVEMQLRELREGEPDLVVRDYHVVRQDGVYVE